MNIRHEIFPAPPDLAPFIESMWVISSDGAPSDLSDMQCCLPSGAWELIVQEHPGSIRITENGSADWLPQFSAIATNGVPVYWQASGGAKALGILLLPDTLERLSGGPSGLSERRYEALSARRQTLFAALAANLSDMTDFRELARQTFDALRAALSAPKPDQAAPYVSDAMRLIRDNLSKQHLIEALDKQVFVSKRQLQRAFQAKLGYTPKAYSRILRFREAIHYLKQHPKARITDVAYDFGYADQSHFIREFKDFTGQNPRRFFAAWAGNSSALFSNKTQVFGQ